MTRAISMETVGAKYASAVGRNTFRRTSERYLDLSPGDEVLMEYAHEAGARPFVSERLTVRALVKGNIHELLIVHAAHNQAIDLDAEFNHTIDPEVHVQSPAVELFGILEAAYGAIEADAQFVVVYFA